MIEEYKLAKDIWTERDFEMMGWHDNRIYKIAFTENELKLDIDYILQWNEPEIKGLPYTFWVAPSTLVFKNISNFSFDFDMVFSGSSEAIEIEDIELSESEYGKSWAILTHQGDLQFNCEGYTQYIRQKPSFQFGQTISFIERNGLSIEKTTNQENPNILKSEITDLRQKDFELYEYVKRRQWKKMEIEQLTNLKDNHEISLKDYISKKRRIQQDIKGLEYWLKDSKFESW